LKYYAYFLVAMLPSRIGIVLRKVKGTAAGSAKSL